MNDILYYAQRYAGIGPGAPYSVDPRAVSASITHAESRIQRLGGALTVGGYSELVLPRWEFRWRSRPWSRSVDLGVLEKRPMGGPLRLAIRIVIVLVIITFVVKGGLVYAVVNWTAVAVILFGVGAVAHALFDRPGIAPKNRRPSAEPRERTEVAA